MIGMRGWRWEAAWRAAVMAGATLLFAACSESVLPATGDLAISLDAAIPLDAAQAPDQAPAPDCVALSACDCLARRDCQPISEDCWCPFPACGPNQCFCSGGRYFGCARTTSRCLQPINCKPPQVATGPDASGCFACR